MAEAPQVGDDLGCEHLGIGMDVDPPRQELKCLHQRLESRRLGDAPAHRNVEEGLCRMGLSDLALHAEGRQTDAESEYYGKQLLRKGN